jgi:hypothetical protein
MHPDSATYQVPDPIPVMKEPKMRYWAQRCLAIGTYPLCTKFAVAIIGGAANWEGDSANDQCPFRTESVDNRPTKHTDCTGMSCMFTCYPRD